MGFQRQMNIKSTRKEHECDGCRELIPKGSKAVRGTGVFEGEFYSYIICIPCGNHLFEYHDKFVDGWGPGDIGESRRVKESE